MRPATLAEVSRIGKSDISSFTTMLSEFLDEFYEDEDPESRQLRILGQPTATGNAEIDAWIGAVGEHLAQRWDLQVPPWVEQTAFMGGPPMRFYPADPATKDISLVESPPAFRRRFLFTFAEPLIRARFPSDRIARTPFDI